MTAERVWRNHRSGIAVRSAGTSPNARRSVSEGDVEWADAICVMEKKHRSRLLAGLGWALTGKPIHVLDIPDEYKFMDPELVQILQSAVGQALGIEY